MKWFFALSEASLHHHDHDWADLIKAAVASARQETSLEPHLVFDGDNLPFADALAALGVKVLRHRVTFYDALAQFAAEHRPGDTQWLGISSGAFLRVELPLLEQQDEFVLYTDCDVVFLKDPAVAGIRPVHFACAPQRYRGDPVDMNSGVMVMNLTTLRQSLPTFTQFIREHIGSLEAFDQGAYKVFYSGQYDALPETLNWKPYWGVEPAAEIVHFHGPKPSAARRLLADPDYDTAEIWRELYRECPPAYAHYIGLWDSYRDAASAVIAHHAGEPPAADR